jgi:hypothetical protein
VEAVARDLFLLENILVRQEFYQQRGEEREKIWGHMCIKRGVVEKKEKIFNVCAEWFC